MANTSSNQREICPLGSSHKEQRLYCQASSVSSYKANNHKSTKAKRRDSLSCRTVENFSRVSSHNMHEMKPATWGKSGNLWEDIKEIHGTLERTEETNTSLWNTFSIGNVRILEESSSELTFLHLILTYYVITSWFEIHYIIISFPQNTERKHDDWVKQEKNQRTGRGNERNSSWVLCRLMKT